jgi:hypothetical protein
MSRSLNEYALSKHREFSRHVLAASLAIYFVMIVLVTPLLREWALNAVTGIDPLWVEGTVSTITGAGAIVAFYSFCMWLYETWLWKFFTPEICIEGRWIAEFTFVEGNRTVPLAGVVEFEQAWDGSTIGRYGYEIDSDRRNWKSTGKYKHVVIQAGGGQTFLALIFETRHTEGSDVGDARQHKARGVEFVEATDQPGKVPTRFEGDFHHFQRDEGLPPRRGFTVLRKPRKEEVSALPAIR